MTYLDKMITKASIVQGMYKVNVRTSSQRRSPMTTTIINSHGRKKGADIKPLKSGGDFQACIEVTRWLRLLVTPNPHSVKPRLDIVTGQETVFGGTLAKRVSSTMHWRTTILTRLMLLPLAIIILMMS